MGKDFKIALCQFHPCEDKEETIEKARTYIENAASGGANVVVLPEMWNSIYSNKYFAKYSEEEGDLSYLFMRDMAQRHGIVLIGGSIPEAHSGKLYNTSYSFDAGGELLGKHRKIHLFDVDVKGGVSFRESDTLSPGDSMTVFDSEYGSFGVAICYDLRFPRLFSDMAGAGAKLIILPASFSATTGPAHFELLIRARSVDDQVYFAACSQALNDDSPFKTYAHSCVSDPWGRVIAQAGYGEESITANIDLSYTEQVLSEIPLRTQTREYRK